jgi:hypothetical protein
MLKTLQCQLVLYQVIHLTALSPLPEGRTTFPIRSLGVVLWEEGCSGGEVRMTHGLCNGYFFLPPGPCELPRG